MSDYLAPDLKALKATTHALVEAVGGCVAAKVILGHRSASTVSAAASISFPDRYMALDDVMTLERHAQQPIVSAWLVERHKADPDRVRHRVSIDDLLRMAVEGSEAKMAVADMLQAANPSAVQRAAVAKEARDVIALYTQILEAVEDVG